MSENNQVMITKFHPGIWTLKSNGQIKTYIYQTLLEVLCQHNGAQMVQSTILLICWILDSFTIWTDDIGSHFMDTLRVLTRQIRRDLELHRSNVESKKDGSVAAEN